MCRVDKILQTYQNQFSRYEPEPLREADINPTVVTDEGPLVAPWVARAALQRSVGKIFYHSGFEDYQPSTLEAMTDLTGEFFEKLVHTLHVYSETHKIPVSAKLGSESASTQQATSNTPSKFTPRFSPEEAILHTLLENGTDLESLTTYIEEDISRLSTKLSSHHDHVKSHLAELLRPALDPNQAGNDGAGAFADGSDSQFVAGDFAADIEEDFFGFKELGLDREFGLSSLSVPLHLLQSRMNNVYQPANTSAAGTGVRNVLENPPPWEPLTQENLPQQIGLVQAFFEEKLSKSGGKPLTEDEELPAKQKLGKPRLPPNGKISSPRKRSQREMQMIARKQKRMKMEKEREREREESGALDRGASVATTVAGGGGMSAAVTTDVSTNDPHAANCVHKDGDEASDVKDAAMTNGENDDTQAENLSSEIRSLPNGDKSGFRGDAVSSLPEDGGSEQSHDRFKLCPPTEDRDNVNADPEKRPQPQQTRTPTEDGHSDHRNGSRNSNGDQKENGDNTGMLSPESLQTIAAH